VSIDLRRIDHVCLRVADLDEAVARWAVQFGLHETERRDGRAYLACAYEPYCLELVAAGRSGHDHTGFELRRGTTLADAAAHLASLGIAYEERAGALHLADPDGNGIELMPYREPEDRRPAIARSTSTLGGFHPKKLGHVNFLTGDLARAASFYQDVLGMRLTDWLGDAGQWFHINADHHVMALVDKGLAHFHHLAFQFDDLAQLGATFDHLGQHGRWLAWGPVRHGIGQNICGYVRIPEEECLVELYCDMEQLEADHQPREWPDDRHSSNTWGPLPPRSYFRFDPAAIESERESLEMLGHPLAPLEH
jgi:catechol 2,3-dioxygenase-like lactoylglutathione lyase family enzyme